MNELSRNLVSAAREGLSPDAAAMARVRARVAASVAASAGAAATVPTRVAKAAKVGKVSTGLGLKLGVSAVVLVTIAASVIATRSAGSQVASPSIAVRAAEADEPEGTLRVAATEPEVAAPPVVAPATATPVHAPVAAPVGEPASLSREVELIDRAVLLVRRGDARDALATLATYQRETRGDGQLAEDAAALDVEARCRLHEDVTARLAAFDRRWPTSAQRSRLQDVCF